MYSANSCCFRAFSASHRLDAYKDDNLTIISIFYFIETQLNLASKFFQDPCGPTSNNDSLFIFRRPERIKTQRILTLVKAENVELKKTTESTSRRIE
jgi:hypothetical protein